MAKFDHIRDPKERVKSICAYGCQVEVDPSIPPKRYFRLFVEKLPKHPEYKQVPPADRAANKKKLVTALKVAEAMKKKLLERYTVEEEKRQAEERVAAAAAEEEARRRREEEAAAEEKRREEAARLASLSEAQRLEELKRQEEEFKRQQEAEYIRLQEENRRRLENLPVDGVAAGGAAAVVAGDLSDLAPPAYTPTPSVPDRSLKPSAPPPAADMPGVDRSTKPDHFTSIGGAGSAHAHGLRAVYVPAELSAKFLNLAAGNTARNVETCGILCGKLAQGSFHITHLVLPKQTGTSDSCTTLNEEELFDVQDKYELITLGWIHTHPTQTAFLSSVDLHTHCGYQLMLPEALAIVCAPKYQQIGNFNLTPGHGLDFISKCRQSGFHPHPSSPALFEEASHVVMDGTSVVVIDLRR